MPDVSIEFDYGVLGIPVQTKPNIPLSASVWIGFTTNTEDILYTFVSYNLVSDVHLIGSWTRN